MIDKIKKVLTDPIAYIFIKTTQFFTFVFKFFCSIYVLCVGWLKGIAFSGYVGCNGIPYLMRVPHSKIKIGKNCIINSSYKSNNIGIFTRTRITTNAIGASVQIGDNVGISGSTISSFLHIEIEDDVLIGGGVLITDSDWHPIQPDLRHQSRMAKAKPVHIGRNVFIGTRSIILKGSDIGENSVIGAGSVVSGVIPANVIAAGNPCKIIKKIDNVN